MDLAKPFNSISHGLFPKKDENLTLSLFLSQSTIYFLQSFLSNQRQCVKLDIDLPGKITINHGVPQGTVLGAPIFLKNDFSENWKLANDIFQFTNDSIITCQVELTKIIPFRNEEM